MSPLEKLAFLEKFAFQGIDLSQIKVRCNNVIKKRNEDLISIDSQLNMASEHLKTLTKPEKVPFPLPCKDKEKAIKNESIRHHNCKILIKRAEKHLEKIKKENNDLKVYTVQIENKQKNITVLKDKIEHLTFEQNTTHYEGDEKLFQYEQKLISMLSEKELFILSERYEEDKVRLAEMEETEKQDIANELKKLKTELWKEYKPDEITTTITEYQQALKDCEILDKNKAQLEKYFISEEKLESNKALLTSTKEKLNERKERLSKLVLQQELYQCPSCQVSLRFQDNNLHLFDEEIPEETEKIEDVEKEISSLTRTINKLEYSIPEEQNKLKRYKELQTEIKNIESQYEDLPVKNEIETNIEYLQNYKRVQIEIEKRCKKLESNQSFSTSLNTFKAQIAKQKDEIKLLESKIKVKSDSTKEEELRHTIQIQRQNKQKIQEYQKQLGNLTRELDIHTSEMNKIQADFQKEYEKIRTNTEVETEIQEKESELSGLKKALEKHEENSKKIEAYKRYKEELGKYQEWKTKVDTLTETEKNTRQKYVASTMMKQKILEAESIAILNIINSINLHAQEYLDLFFPTDPIVVRLLPFKQTKKDASKPQINLEIDYKGMEADISTLSGGELSRVVLAYTLALAEIFNSPLILLDECTASLDQDLATAVMEGIKKNFGNKLVVIIAHQIISGDFDKQISL
jgi:DNA repair exonuclease SbcCD ATPase subunit